ncbi:hypothetical protein GIB67_019549 [Kingdonia uniflora]|uniref:NAB domain-containing protein n=1 Tax=Kingdonia uniflora TaxID=39325 RepID=A0A7J7N089_9MAGN|nr:hypothetical protein GIB67_019549 [Kingdonia uniflora]
MPMRRDEAIGFSVFVVVDLDSRTGEQYGIVVADQESEHWLRFGEPSTGIITRIGEAVDGELMRPEHLLQSVVDLNIDGVTISLNMSLLLFGDDDGDNLKFHLDSERERERGFVCSAPLEDCDIGSALAWFRRMVAPAVPSVQTIYQEEKVQYMLKLIEADGDSFAKRAEMYYRKRPELISFVEESYRAYRALAERYEHISGELQNANTTIATVFPEQVQFAMDEEDENGSPRIPRRPMDPNKLPIGFRGVPDIPKFPNFPKKITRVQSRKKGQPPRQEKIENTKTSGKSKTEAIEEIDKLQKGILALQTEKEFVKESYENGLAKYWEIEKRMEVMQDDICNLHDEFNVGSVIEDDEARTLMAATALKSCQETLVHLQEKQERSAEEARAEYQRIKDAHEKLEHLKDEFLSDEKKETYIDLTEPTLQNVEQQESELIREKIREHFETNSGTPLSVSELAEKIDELVTKVISLETAVSSQTALINRLRSETDELQTNLQSLEDDKEKGSKNLNEKLRELEHALRGVQDLNKNVENQSNNLQTHFTQAHCNFEHLSEKLHTVKESDDEVESVDSVQFQAEDGLHAASPNQLEERQETGEKFEEPKDHNCDEPHEEGEEPFNPRDGTALAVNDPSEECKELKDHSNLDEPSEECKETFQPNDNSANAHGDLLEKRKEPEDSSNIDDLSEECKELKDHSNLDEPSEACKEPFQPNDNSANAHDDLPEKCKEPEDSNIDDPSEKCEKLKDHRNLDEPSEECKEPFQPNDNIANARDDLVEKCKKPKDSNNIDDLSEEPTEPFALKEIGTLILDDPSEEHGEPKTHSALDDSSEEPKVEPFEQKDLSEQDHGEEEQDETKNQDSVKELGTSQTEDSVVLNVEQQEEDILRDQPNWQQLFLNGLENREQILLAEYTSILRNYKETKRKLSEIEKKNRDSLFETMVQVRELKSVNAMKDEEIRSLQQKLSFLQTSSKATSFTHWIEFKDSEKGSPRDESTMSSDENIFNLTEKKSNEAAKSPPVEEEDEEEIKVILPVKPLKVSIIEEKFRRDIDELLEENLEFWLRFSTSFHQIQNFETAVQDLQSEYSKLKENKKQQENTEQSLRSDARSIYKHLREIQTELNLWLEQNALLKDELSRRLSSLCSIQDEIERVSKTGSEVEDVDFTSYQAAKFQGEVINMQQENNKVADELQAGLDHVQRFQFEIEKTLSQLNEDFKLSGSKNHQQHHSQDMKHSASRTRIPLRSFIFGNRPKRQKPKMFMCMNPALQKQYSDMNGGYPM